MSISERNLAEEKVLFMFSMRKALASEAELCWLEFIHGVTTIPMVNMELAPRYKASRYPLQLEPGYDFVSKPFANRH